jgi:hypothetical protein
VIEARDRLLGLSRSFLNRGDTHPEERRWCAATARTRRPSSRSRTRCGYGPAGHHGRSSPQGPVRRPPHRVGRAPPPPRVRPCGRGGQALAAVVLWPCGRHAGGLPAGGCTTDGGGGRRDRPRFRPRRGRPRRPPRRRRRQPLHHRGCPWCRTAKRSWTGPMRKADTGSRLPNGRSVRHRAADGVLELRLPCQAVVSAHLVACPRRRGCSACGQAGPDSRAQDRRELVTFRSPGALLDYRLRR